MGTSRVDIVVCVYNAKDWVQRCIEGVNLFSLPYPYRLIVVDDGSDDVTKKYLRSVQGITLIENDANMGYLRSANVGFRASTADYVLFLNSDVIVTPYWLERMVATADLDVKIGIADSVFSEGPIFGNIIPEGYSFWDVWRCGFAKAKIEALDIVNAVGACMLVKRSVIDAIGVFDESYGFGYGEESDYCMRAMKRGFRIVKAVSVLVYHKTHGSQTDKEVEERTKSSMDLFMRTHKEEFERLSRKLAPNVDYYRNRLREIQIERRHCAEIVGGMPHILWDVVGARV